MPNDSHQQLAQRHAPIFAQKVFREWAAADQIAPVDFAGSLGKVAENPNTLNAKAPDFRIANSKVYYSVCETATHHFLIYAVYHVFDWWKRVHPNNLYDLIRDSLDEHVHDMEGVLIVIRKNPTDTVDAVVTVAHNNFYLYTRPMTVGANGKPRPASREALRVVKFNESVDGNVWLDRATGRVKIYIEARGHGVRGDHKKWGGGDEVWYYRPEGETGDPSAFNRDDVALSPPPQYTLEDIFAPQGLWAHRFNPRVFKQGDGGKWAFVHRKKLTSGGLVPGKANPPWSWNDHNDASPIGEMATDPARFILRYAQGWGPVSTQYTSNKYLGIE